MRKVAKRLLKKKTRRFSEFYPYPQPWILPLPSGDEVESNQLILTQDAEIHDGNGYLLIVARDGMILLRDDKLEREIAKIQESWELDLALAKSFEDPWRDNLKNLKVIYFLLECAMHFPGKRNIYLLSFFELDRASLRRVSYDDSDIPISQVTYGQETKSDLIRFGKLKIDPPIKQSLTIDVDVIDDMHECYAVIIDKGLIDEVAQIAKCVSNFKLRDSRTSLLWSWLQLETYINFLWRRHLGERNNKGDRKKRMLGRDYVISIVLEALEYEGDFSSEEFDQLPIIRKARNDLVHEGRIRPSLPPIERTCRDALDIIRSSFHDKYGVDLSFSPHSHPTRGL